MLICVGLLVGCFAPNLPPATLFQLEEGQVYGPVLPTPISIRLGQSMVRASGSVGPTVGSQGSPAVWEGHALALQPDAERNRTLFVFVDGDGLERVTLQFNDQEPIVEERPGAYLSAEFATVRWAQEYSLRVTARHRSGVMVSSAIYVNGEDAHLEEAGGEPPLRMRLLRMGQTEVREVSGAGYRGKLYRHPWPACAAQCDLTAPGGVLVAMVSGTAETVALVLDGRYPYFASGLNTAPGPDYLIVAIPVREELIVEIAALNGAGDLVTGRWDKPALGARRRGTPTRAADTPL
jgi:hypothetical protein